MVCFVDALVEERRVHEAVLEVDEDVSSPKDHDNLEQEPRQ